MKQFYAPTFIDESMTLPDKKGRSRPTGRLSGIVFARKFSRRKGGGVKAERIMISFSWNEDTQEAKTEALAKAIAGMDELPGLDTNPPLNWVPSEVKEALDMEIYRG